jgi:hypothetical protein
MPGRKKQHCGAQTRKGTPCRCKALANGRCRLHGGLSTGPKTPEGKARALGNLKRYRRAPDPKGVPVKYIGRKAVKYDNVCSTGLQWTPGQVIMVPREVAERLLRHPDVWVVG